MTTRLAKGTVIPLRPERPKKQKRRRTAPEETATGLGEAPNKPLAQRLAYPPRLSLNGLLVSIFAFTLLLMSGFLPLALPNPLQWGAAPDIQVALPYTLQLPLALILSVFLGPFMGVGLLAIYLLTGLCGFPLFANGGGFSYVFQPGFGYWLGTLIVCIPMAQRYHRFCLAERHAIWRVFKQGLLGMLAVHLIGAMYMALLGLSGQIPAQDLPGWLSRLSLEPLPYDCLAALLGFSLIRPLRLLCWWILY